MDPDAVFLAQQVGLFPLQEAGNGTFALEIGIGGNREDPADGQVAAPSLVFFLGTP